MLIVAPKKNRSIGDGRMLIIEDSPTGAMSPRPSLMAGQPISAMTTSPKILMALNTVRAAQENR